MEALRRVDEWRRLLAGVPPLDTIFEVDYRLLAERLADIPDEVNRILRLFDGVRTFLQVIDDCGLPDLDAVAAIGKLYRERIVHDIRVPQDEDEAVGADMEGWLSEAAGPFRSPQRQERDLFGAGPDRGVGVHGRRTAPIDPLGDGAREALDDDMRVRFTDRLQAEGTAAPDAAGAPGADGIPEVPLEALMESAPTGNGSRPATLPGMGTSKSTAPGMATAATEPSRPAIAIPVMDAATAPVVMPAVPEDISATATLQGRASSAEPPPPPPAASSPPAETSLLAPAAPTPPPAAVSPLERPYGWSSSEGPGRSVSGEILIVRKTPPIPLATADIPRVHVKEDSGKAYIRKTTVTPPGSARALDEPPPIPLTKAEESGRASAAKSAEAIPVPQPREKSNRKIIKVDDGRDDAFSKSMAEDELGMSSRRKKALVIAGISAAAVMVIFALVKVTRHKPPAGQETDVQAQQQAPAATPEQATAPVIEPIQGTGTESNAQATGPKPPPPKTFDTSSMAGHKPPLAPLGASREELDERAADPRMARERGPQARPLLYVCRLAFDQKRMRDAEPACIAARDANPESAEAYRLLAHAQFNRNKRHEALASAERAVKIEPKLADMYVIIGGVHQEDGDADEARRAYQRYLELEPKGSYAADLRAIIGRLPAKL
jgi:hypothetical protein